MTPEDLELGKANESATAQVDAIIALVPDVAPATVVEIDEFRNLMESLHNLQEGWAEARIKAGNGSTILGIEQLLKTCYDGIRTEMGDLKTALETELAAIGVEG